MLNALLSACRNRSFVDIPCVLARTYNSFDCRQVCRASWIRVVCAHMPVSERNIVYNTIRRLISMREKREIKHTHQHNDVIFSPNTNISRYRPSLLFSYFCHNKNKLRWYTNFNRNPRRKILCLSQPDNGPRLPSWDTTLLLHPRCTNVVIVMHQWSNVSVGTPGTILFHSWSTTLIRIH